MENNKKPFGVIYWRDEASIDIHYSPNKWNGVLSVPIKFHKIDKNDVECACALKDKLIELMCLTANVLFLRAPYETKTIKEQIASRSFIRYMQLGRPKTELPYFAIIPDEKILCQYFMSAKHDEHLVEFFRFLQNIFKSITLMKELKPLGGP